MIRVLLPFHLQTLAACGPEVQITVPAPATPRAVITALEARFPTLRGAIVEHVTGKRRPLIRFFACQQDISHDGMDIPLPAAIISGAEPFMIVGAIAGG